MTNQVSTVDTGNVPGVKRVERACIVPIEKVTAESLHAFHRRKDFAQALLNLRCGNITEVPRCQIRQKGQSDVRGRRPVGDGYRWVFLEIVGGQPVILLTEEGLEKAPRLARDVFKI